LALYLVSLSRKYVKMPIESGFTLTDILWKFSLYFSWFFVILIGYKSKKWWIGLIVGFLVWSPTIIIAINSPHFEDASLGIAILLLLTIIAAIMGSISGFLGAKFKKR